MISHACRPQNLLIVDHWYSGHESRHEKQIETQFKHQTFNKCPAKQVAQLTRILRLILQLNEQLCFVDGDFVGYLWRICGLFCALFVLMFDG